MSAVRRTKSDAPLFERFHRIQANRYAEFNRRAEENNDFGRAFRENFPLKEDQLIEIICIVCIIILYIIFRLFVGYLTADHTSQGDACMNTYFKNDCHLKTSAVCESLAHCKVTKHRTLISDIFNWFLSVRIDTILLEMTYIIIIVGIFLIAKIFYEEKAKEKER